MYYFIFMDPYEYEYVKDLCNRRTNISGKQELALLALYSSLGDNC